MQKPHPSIAKTADQLARFGVSPRLVEQFENCWLYFARQLEASGTTLETLQQTRAHYGNMGADCLAWPDDVLNLRMQRQYLRNGSRQLLRLAGIHDAVEAAAPFQLDLALEHLLEVHERVQEELKPRLMQAEHPEQPQRPKGPHRYIPNARPYAPDRAAEQAQLGR